MKIIYTVEDDDNIRELLRYALSQAGFDAQGFADGAALFDALHAAAGCPQPALILLDIMLPGEDGVSVLKKLKSGEKTRAIPVIMLTARGGEYDRIHGLELGADDYITKPFSVMEVIARVKAVLRRSVPERGAGGEIGAGDVRLFAEQRSVFSGEEEVPLTFKEFELLYFLLRNKGRALTREKILEHVWGYEYYGETRTVDMHIKSLRQKLNAGGRLIKTVRNVGYKLEG
jgi:two-component system alkaline phosphatase synthesis response regulator PhoP